eukprot:1694015-Pyramimonas_sp.AAC.1
MAARMRRLLYAYETRTWGGEGIAERGYILTMDQSDTASGGIFSRWTNQTQQVGVYSHDEPIRHSKRGYILTMDQSDTAIGGIFSRWTNQTQQAG